ncbi:MAG: DNA polymerase III subunit alpha [Caldilineaceae bacterium]
MKKQAAACNLHHLLPTMGDTVDNFVHLHVHSEYSMLDGLGRIKNLVKEAKKLGQPALALTDHGVMHGAIEFFRACKENGIKPLIGIEAYQTVHGRPMGGRDSQFDRENYHLLLLARNMTGYRNLLKIATHSQLDGYYYRPRVDHDFLAKHAEGIVCTTGCLGAEVPNLLLQGKEKEAYKQLGWYCDVFGKENFFVELQEHTIEELRPVNKILVPWAKEFGLKLLPTNDVHYVRESDGGPHDVLLCVQTGVTVHEKNRMKMSDGSYFLKSRAQMEETFRPFVDLPDYVFDHTLQIMEMCDVDLEDKNYHLPDLPIPEGHTYDTYLRQLTEEGLHRLYGERANSDFIQERKERELRVIAQMGFSIYFLIVADLCHFAKSRNIWWNVRGSGAGSMVAYCIGITGLDPMKNNLIFERFLNPGRVSMPDFDLDFPDDQREEMIKYTVQRYGESQVAQIATFNRMKAKAAVRDVGRAQGIELAKVDKIAKLIPGIPGKPVTIQDCLTEGHEFYSAELLQMYQDEQWVRELLETAKQLEGVARNSGIHAAAVIVADRELSHYTPLMRSSKSAVTSTIAQYEFPILESIGLLKVDFLGLSTLSVMREACRLIKERHGIEYTLQNIPFEGEPAKEAFKLLSSGEVSGVFQVESQGMRRVLTEMKPNKFEHIIAMISLYRPGPLEYIPQFIRRMHGEEEIVYKHPMLESILSETYAIIVYQEQIIQVLSKLAGYTPGEADLVRRAISKKKASDIEKHKKLFIAGCEKNGIDPEISEAIYNDIEFFARYGFNKSHAADYAVITVQTAYLKAHYPVEYMAAQLLIERDKTEKVTNFITECRRMGVEVLPPDVNYSGLDFDIQQVPPETKRIAQRDPSIAYPFPIPDGSAIRFGMAAIKNVGEGPVHEILHGRKDGGPFKTLEDFCGRVDLRKVNKRSLECLIKAGCLDSFGKRSQLLAVLDTMVANSAAAWDAQDSGQLSIFDLFSSNEAKDHSPTSVALIKLPEMEEAKGKEKLQWEKELLGVYSISHPMNNFGADLSRVVTCSCAELDERHDGKNIILGGMISNIRTITTKKGDPMAFVQLEDLQGSCEVVFFPKTYAELKEQLVQDMVLLIKGKAQTREGRTSLLADGIQRHIDKAVAIGADPSLEYQRPLLDAPSVNGLSYEHADAKLDEEEVMVTSEGSPFAGEMPTWLNDAPPPPLDDDEPAIESEIGAPRVIAPILPPKVLPKTVESAVAMPPKVAQPAKRSLPEPSAIWYDFDARKEASMADDEEPKAQPTTQAVSLENTESSKPEPSTPETSMEEPLVANESSSNTELTTPAPATKVFATPAQSDDTQEPAHRRPSPSGNGNANGAISASKGMNGHGSNGFTSAKKLRISLRRSGDIERDKYRLKQIYDAVSDPRGRDHFFIKLVSETRTAELSFPNDGCTISEKLLNELTKHFRVEVTVEEPMKG